MCSVPYCKNRPGTTGLSFHKIPRDPAIRKIWIGAINRESNPPALTSTVCSAHFKDEELNKTYHSGYSYLKPNSVPSIFYFPHSDAKVKDEKFPDPATQVKEEKVDEPNIEVKVKEKTTDVGNVPALLLISNMPSNIQVATLPSVASGPNIQMSPMNNIASMPTIQIPSVNNTTVSSIQVPVLNNIATIPGVQLSSITNGTSVSNIQMSSLNNIQEVNTSKVNESNHNRLQKLLKLKLAIVKRKLKTAQQTIRRQNKRIIRMKTTLREVRIKNKILEKMMQCIDTPTDSL